ncbi:MAG: sigma-70 family RNA polymerase sigma factor [Clostridia bacterium]|nr:sigma-70 family RNA polymerase sigma factor [Clostridia bacterium]MBQ9804916.1 sigma-70 family RNA polymerase sigma factor [Clostridia bacterium]
MASNNVNQENTKCLSDEEIIELYWKRNEHAIAQTDRKYGKYLFTIAYNIVHDRQDSEECLNDTYLGTWNKIPPERPSVFNVFLARIMRNIAINRYRRNTAEKRIPTGMVIPIEELEDTLTTDPLTPDEAAVCALTSVLNRFIGGLDEREEFIFVCRYYYSDSVKHIAKLLQISEPTVFRCLAKMRTDLREMLNKEGIGQ